MDAAPDTFTACALVKTITRTVKVSRWDEETKTLVDAGERTDTEETGRIEFIPAGDWVFVRVVKSNYNDRFGHAWGARTREEARAFYREILGGRGWYGSGWTKGEPKTQIVGAVDLPARTVSFAWGEGANRVAYVDLPAARCPVIRSRHYSTVTENALQAFTGTFEGWTAHRVQWTEMSRSYV